MMKIERVTTEDAEELLSIYAPYVEQTAITFEYTVPTQEEFTGRIRKISAKYPYIKAVQDGRIAGYAYAACFYNRAAYDWSVETTVYLRKDCRRQGIGQALYMQLEKCLTSMGILNMNACIAVPREQDGADEYLNDDSLHFHEARGFSLVGRFHNSGYKFDRWYDMVWMEKMIGAHEHAEPVCFGRFTGMKV